MKADSPEPQESGRVLGEYSWGAPGPLLLVTGGLHGNEPGGVQAVRRVLDALKKSTPPMRGEVVALAGNLEALRLGQRYVERDLNRAWWKDDIARLRDPAAPDYAGELGEMQDLLTVIDEHMRDHRDEVILLDLHSTSAEGAPFAIMGDTVQNRRVAFALGIPVILGLEELVDGTLLSYMGGEGHVAFVVEGGQHVSPTTADHLEAAVWLTIVAAGMMHADDVPVDLDAKRRLLTERAAGLPRAVEIRHRHGLRPEEDFRMEPGFTNFQRVGQGDVLAYSGPGTADPIASPTSGLLLLPRYQGQGDDGFFVGREVHPFWLWLSTLLRVARVHRILPWLPGVRRDPRNPQILLADRRVARWTARQLFHLFGFRESRRRGTDLVFVRRPDRF